MLAHFIIGLGLLLGGQTATTPGQTYAVVIGIADYQALSARTGDLRFADRDAQQVASFLQSKSGSNVPASHIRLLTNRQATKANIQQAMTLFRQAKAGDRVILYFSGHGLSDSFAPYDVQPGSQRKLLTHKDIKAAFHESGATTKLCIADACLSGSMTQQQTVRRNTAQAIAGNREANVAMLLASRSTQNSIENRRLVGGLFTYYLLQGLKGQGDLNGDKIVTIRELHQYISPRIRQESKGLQAPVFYGRFSDELALAYL